jgi:hypothetical protein
MFLIKRLVTGLRNCGGKNHKTASLFSHLLRHHGGVESAHDDDSRSRPGGKFAADAVEKNMTADVDELIKSFRRLRVMRERRVARIVIALAPIRLLISGRHLQLQKEQQPIQIG